jgi:RluA family pseudouridine synthase
MPTKARIKYLKERQHRADEYLEKKKKNYQLKNIKEYQVNKEIELLEFLYSVYKDESRNNVKSILSKRHVAVNGLPVTQYNYMLYRGDVVQVSKEQLEKINAKLPASRTPQKPKINIIYEDKDFIVINKPNGLLTIESDKEKTDTAYKLVLEYMSIKDKHARCFQVHRLDKETSGIVLFAKRENVKNAYQENWNELVKTRRYIAIVNGYLDKKEGTIHTWLAENKNKMVYSTKNKEIGKEAITEYKVKKENNNLSLVEVYIKTGRKNQIRVHLKELGNSILGDVKYGGNKANRLYLHNDKLVLRNPFNNKTLSFELSLPNEFNKIMK